VSGWDRLGYDKDGNHFRIDKTQFAPGRYWIEFKVQMFGLTLYYKNRDWRFDITEDFVLNSLYW